MMDPSSSLQIPDMSIPGPSSRQYRPVSVAVQPTTTSPPSSSRKRASHTVVSSNHQQQQQQQSQQQSQMQQQQQQGDDDRQPAYRDVYAHPAAVAYAAAHPRRTIPKFGPYLLLQTLGEGEFGKVKLGLHSQWGEEVAVKLIRRGNIDTTVRMSKVEREIEVLRTLKHPNIVRLYDVIETDKYIGIILEYASGGELFDHILAHRYLKEKDAAKLFSQLISGVWYIHQKKIVHRDLKLENLLLDRHRNVIITDFGFANRFEHRSDDLMQTSCGSPCYAAPELVISEGLYVGSAVDIWSCGVILYAMLAGYLPFDDDPANPDGDNINLLYKYIVNTPLSFPDYISEEARDLLCMMLVPDPTRRADLHSIMQHSWLAPFSSVFERSVDEVERAAMEQHQMKRLAYQRQMKQAAVASVATEPSAKVSRTQSARTDVFSGPSSSAATSSRTQVYNKQQPEYLYETSVDQSMNSSYSPPVIPPGARRGASSTAIPSSVPLDDDPFAPSPGDLSLPIHMSAAEDRRAEKAPAHAPVSLDAKKKGGFRHTIQVEYGDPDAQDAPLSQSPPRAVARKQVPEVENQLTLAPVDDRAASRARTISHDSPSAARRRAEDEDDAAASIKPLPSPAAAARQRRDHSTPPPRLPEGAITAAQKAVPVVSVAAATPLVVDADRSFQSEAQVKKGPSSISSKQSGQHRRGLSVDKLGLGKIFGSGSPSGAEQEGVSSRVPSDSSAADSGIHAEKQSSHPPTVNSDASLINPVDPVSTKKSRRNTLTVMVEPFRQTMKRKGKTPDTPKEKQPPASQRAPLSAVQTPPIPPYANTSKTDIGTGIPASTNKANKVMQWFRTKSKGSADPPVFTEEPSIADLIAQQDKEHAPATPTQVAYNRPAAASSSATVNQDRSSHRAQGVPVRTASTATDASVSQPTLGDRFRRSVGVAAPTPAKGVLRIHHGAVDNSTVTTKSPPVVMKHIREVLEGMGMDIRLESEFKYRCVRLKKKKIGGNVGLGFREIASGNGLATVNMVGSAASNGVDKRGLPAPSPSFGATGGMLKGLLMRRQSSQVSTSGMSSQPSLPLDEDPVIAEPNSPTVHQETVYGDVTQDAGDEVRFSVELTRLDRLNDTFSLDIRRLKGNLRSYKFLYDTLRERADLQR